MRKIVWMPVAAVVAIAFAANAGGGGGESEDTSTTASETVTEVADAPAPAKAPAKKPAAKPAAPKPAYAGALKDDVVLAAGAPSKLSGWTTSVTALKAGDSTLGKTLCTTVTHVNRDDKEQDFNMTSWKLQSPSGAIETPTFIGSDDMLDPIGSLAPGGTVEGDVCFDNKKATTGQYILSWQPDMFSSKDRAVWLQKL